MSERKVRLLAIFWVNNVQLRVLLEVWLGEQSLPLPNPATGALEACLGVTVVPPTL